MSTAVTVFLGLYLPLLFGILCLAIALRSLRGEKRIIAKLKPFGDFVEYHVELSNVLIVRGLLIAGAVLSFSVYLFEDYSSYFPQRYQMEVFFDEEGIDRSLRAFRGIELANLSIPNSRSSYRDLYFQELDTDIQKTFGDPAFFNMKTGYVHSTGEAQIAAEKLGLWQNYHVILSEGQLTHILEAPNQEPKKFFTRFEKLPSKDDYLNLTVTDLFVHHSVMLKTHYKQILVLNKMSEGLVFKLTVVGITELTVFPWPEVSNTVYLAHFDNVGLVPVAYAIYR